MRRSLQKGVVLLLLLLVTAMSLEQDMAVPISTQYPLFLKILTYDRNIEARAPDEIVIGLGTPAVWSGVPFLVLLGLGLVYTVGMRVVIREHSGGMSSQLKSRRADAPV